jgi:hypothetical protein
MRLLPLALAAVLALVLAVPAGAATVRTDSGNAYFGEISVEAGPGEANVVEVSFSRDTLVDLVSSILPIEPALGATRITDTGAPITLAPGARCSHAGPNEVSCVPGPVAVRLGDLDDQVTFNSGWGSSSGPPFNGFANVGFGGPGADTLVAGTTSGGSFLAGEDGDDTLKGGLDSLDGFAGGAGNDRITSLDLLAEDVFCGPGDDVVLPDVTDRRASSCERIGLT